MAHETVLVSTSELDPALQPAVMAACEQAKAVPMRWNRADGPAPSGISPALLIGVLPAGERRIPDDLLHGVTKTHPGLPLLLLCKETLVRDAVVLNDGRVTLLGQPLTAEKIAARISAVISARGAAENAAGPAGLRVVRGANWWASAVTRFAGGRPPAGEPTFPYLVGSEGEGFAAVVTAHPPEPAESAGIKNALDSLRRMSVTSAGASGSSQSGALLPLRSAAVWLPSDASQWSIFVPPTAPDSASPNPPQSSAWLISSLRLPSVWNAASAETPLRTLKAGGGDLMLLHSDPAGSPWPAGPLGRPEDRDEIRRIAQGGGSAVLEFLDARLNKFDGNFAAVLVEVW